MLEFKKPFVMQYISRNDPFRHWATLEQWRQRITSLAIIKEILEFPKNVKITAHKLQSNRMFFWLQTSTPTLVISLAVWVEQVATRASKSLSSCRTSWVWLVMISKMFQALLQYYCEDGFASFFLRSYSATKTFATFCAPAPEPSKLNQL